MARAIKLSVLTGPHSHVRYCFRATTSCLVGRCSDCLVQFVGHKRDSLISRRHCRLDVEMPRIWITDLGSCNGTFVNGKNIAQRDKSESPRVELQNGDMVTIGGTTLKVNFIDCPFTSPPETGLEETPLELSTPGCQEENCLSCDGECLRAHHSELLRDNATVLWVV